MRQSRSIRGKRTGMLDDSAAADAAHDFPQRTCEQALQPAEWYTHPGREHEPMMKEWGPQFAPNGHLSLGTKNTWAARLAAPEAPAAVRVTIGHNREVESLGCRWGLTVLRRCALHAKSQEFI